MNEEYTITVIKLLTLNQIKAMNKNVEKQALKDKKIDYINRLILPDVERKMEILPDCAEKYHTETGDIILTASYYLKNIIILQSFEDGNHRTALIATKRFLDLHGYNRKKIIPECYSTFQRRLFMYRNIEYYTYESTPVYVLKIDDNTVKNKVFRFCLNFIKNEMLR